MQVVVALVLGWLPTIPTRHVVHAAKTVIDNDETKPSYNPLAVQYFYNYYISR